MKRFSLLLSAVFVILGVFWTERESTHGIGAFSEHWWCPIPLAMIWIGIAGLVAASLLSAAAGPPPAHR